MTVEEENILFFNKQNNKSKLKTRRASFSTAEFYQKKDLKSVPCKFFKSGKCTAGENCTFSHSLENWTDQSGCCPFFLKGTCKFGEQCSLPHIPDRLNQNSLNKQVPILPLPEYCNDPSAPIEIRKKSLPDIFQWSVESSQSHGLRSGSISPHSLFFSSSIKEYSYPQAQNFVSRFSVGPKARSMTMSSLREFVNRQSLFEDQVDENPGTPSIETEFEYSCEQLQQFTMDSIDEQNERNFQFNEEDTSNKLCPFESHSSCKFGKSCKFLHGEKCDLCGRNCLHPTDQFERRKHIVECTKKIRAETQQKLVNQTIFCLMCSERIYPDKKFALMFCEHPFCIPCIRSHRAVLLSNDDPVCKIQKCPLESCPVITPFITPSADWIEGQEERKLIIEAYRSKISGIPCKYWNFGEDVCPFGKDCFYSHFGASSKIRSNSSVQQSLFLNESMNQKQNF